MTSPTLTTLLENEFKNPIIKKKCLAKFKNKELRNRVFDDLLILPSQLINYLAKKFSSIYNKVKIPEIEIDHPLELLSSSVKNEMIVFEKEIVKKGCQELLNDDGLSQE